MEKCYRMKTVNSVLDSELFNFILIKILILKTYKVSGAMIFALKLIHHTILFNKYLLYTLSLFLWQLTIWFIIFIWGKVLEKSARPGFKPGSPGTLGFLAQCSTEWAIEACFWTSQQNQPTTVHIATTLFNVFRSRSRWFFRTVGSYPRPLR